MNAKATIGPYARDALAQIRTGDVKEETDRMNRRPKACESAVIVI